jgi:hypothetical protein
MQTPLHKWALLEVLRAHSELHSCCHCSPANNEQALHALELLTLR